MTDRIEAEGWLLRQIVKDVGQWQNPAKYHEAARWMAWRTPHWRLRPWPLESSHEILGRNHRSFEIE